MTSLKGRVGRLLGASLLLSVTCANAETMQNTSAFDYLKHLEVSVAGGIDWYNKSNTTLVISPFETDSDQTNHSTTNGSWKVGAGYYLFEDKLQQRRFLNKLLLEVNFYQTSTNLSGSVWQYELPQFNNYNFRAPIRSSRLMLDVKPTLFTWKKISPYPILGMGMAWNTVSYDETVTGEGVDPNSTFSLSNSTTRHIAWDVGAGCNFALTSNLSATAEYLHANLGHASPANSANLTTVPNFSLQTQSVLLGFNLKIS